MSERDEAQIKTYTMILLLLLELFPIRVGNMVQVGRQ